MFKEQNQFFTEHFADPQNVTFYLNGPYFFLPNSLYLLTPSALFLSYKIINSYLNQSVSTFVPKWRRFFTFFNGRDSQQTRCQFHQHFMSAFFANIFASKKLQSQMLLEKSCSICFCTKNAGVKCWWNWLLNYHKDFCCSPFLFCWNRFRFWHDFSEFFHAFISIQKGQFFTKLQILPHEVNGCIF